jgi:hypothetical protein
MIPIDRNDAPRLRSVITRSGSSGLRLRACNATNAASSSTPVNRKPIVVWLPQLVVCACEKPYTSANSPVETVSAPARSSFGFTAGAWLWSSESAPTIAIVANTRLTYML